MFVGPLTLYPLPSRDRLYKVAWPGYTPEKNPIDVGWTTFYPLPSKEHLYKVACPGYTPEKTQSMLRFICPLPGREHLYKVPGYTPEKDPIDVGWATLYTRSRAEKASIKWPVRGAPPEKTSIDVGWTTSYTSSPFHPFAIQSGVAT